MHPAEQSPLGKSSNYSGIYTPSLLYSINRQPIWEGLGLDPEQLPFQGADVWNSYEVSWLTPSGKPEVAAVEFTFPLTATARMVESKSFKLYLNSFNQTVFSDRAEVMRTLESDLSVTAQAPVMVRVLDMARLQQLGLARLPGESLDAMDVRIDTYSYSPHLLQLLPNAGQTRQTLHSNLLKSNCPVTGQPDWASVIIHYAGPTIDQASLLRYLVSFRDHADFHEQCVERIFLDLHQLLGKGCELSVYARYLRRGGLDINPWRSNQPGMPDNLRLARQ